MQENNATEPNRTLPYLLDNTPVCPPCAIIHGEIIAQLRQLQEQYNSFQQKLDMICEYVGDDEDAEGIIIHVPAANREESEQPEEE